MAESGAVPEALAHLTDLSLDATGTFVLYATDDYFAPKEALVRPSAPEWREGAYTERGKWMDGWESQRRRTPGHDFVILRLGTPGAIEGLLCDTTHFKGNAPQEVSLEAIELPATASVDFLLGLPVAANESEQAERGGPAWLEIVPRTAVRPDHPNVITLTSPSARATHVRLRIHPDGGVARLRVFGHVIPEPGTFRGAAAVDLAAVENGGTIAAVSDAFFGPPANLLLPGRGTSMGDGWETKRRRTPGSDWCVVQLGRRGVVQRIELDTHFFKGNAPQATRVEYLDAGKLSASELATRLASSTGWPVLLDTTPVVQHRRHVLEPAIARAATHLRVHILPHGGVNRLRVYGCALDTAGEAGAVAALNALPEAGRRAALLSFCGAAGYADRLAAGFPVPGVRELFAASDTAFAALDEAGLLEAFAAHPKLGETAAAKSATAASAAWSAGEQAGVSGADAGVLESLRECNQRYAERFGFIFIAYASGRTAAEILAVLEERLAGTREEEIARAAREQARITRARIGKWLAAHDA